MSSSSSLDLDLKQLQAYLPQAALALAAGYGLYIAYQGYRYIFPYTVLQKLPGPSNGHPLLGNMREIFKAENGSAHKKWMEDHGHVVAYREFLNRPRLLTTDLRALAHILQHHDIYQKPATVQRSLASIVGWGVLLAEGEQHRVQRKALNPAFGPAQLRAQTGVFLDKSNELRDILSAASIKGNEAATVDVVPFLTRATMDIIGLAGFGYTFNSLTHPEQTNELEAAFTGAFSAAQSAPIMAMLNMLVPGFRQLPTKRNKQTMNGKRIMDTIGNQLIAERKASALLDAAQGEKITETLAGQRDLLSLLVRANTTVDPRERLSDADILAQIPTFILAGHETTSSLMAWVLFELGASENSALQSALRTECRSLPLPTSATGSSPLDAPDLAALDKLPLLDAIVRETLRLHAPVGSTIRSAIKDDVIPLSKPYVDRKGVLQDSIRMSKGDGLYVPITIVNKSEDLWGADAGVWKPERWMEGGNGVPAQVKAVPGVWGNVMTFLGGAHACIGYRFTIYETKILTHALISQLSFELARPRADFSAHGGITNRPVITEEREKGPQLPLRVRRVGVDEE